MSVIKTKYKSKSLVYNFIYPEFLAILHFLSRGGQNDVGYFNSIFTDEEGNCTSTLEIIPPHCTPFCQPCDAYFFRQIKNFIKKIQNAIEILQNNRELLRREDAIKIYSFIHNQLSAPVFNAMIKYSWYAIKLISHRFIFFNVNQVYFPDVRKAKCSYNNMAFIKCSYC